MDKKHLEDLYALKALESQEDVMRWYGWGSPIGLSIFFWTIVGIAVVIKLVLFK